jgi:hypothetical protein
MHEPPNPVHATLPARTVHLIGSASPDPSPT